MSRFLVRAAIVRACPIAILLLLPGCYAMRRSNGGGHADFGGERRVRAEDVALPAGYRIEAVARGLVFPTGVAFDDRGDAYVVESGYAYGEVWATPRLLRVARDGSTRVIASGGRNGPWTGAAWYRGSFYVAEGGEWEGGRILRVGRDGGIEPIAEGLPSVGDHHTNGPVVGPDGWLYFGQGTATNAGVVGEDNAAFGWLARHPDFHDVPCRDVTLTGRNVRTRDVREGRRGHVETGAYLPFGTPSAAGQVIRGRVPCSGAVFRMRPTGSAPELVAWGLRNPFGLAFSPDGRLFVTDNMYDDRGSRAVHGAGDLLWSIERGGWYGWPDWHGDRRLDLGDHYQPPGKPRPKPVLAPGGERPPRPAAIFAVHSSADGFDFSRSERFGHVGEAFVALFGDQSAVTGKSLSPVGFQVVRVDVQTGVMEQFAVNRGRLNGPASKLRSGGLERPVAARFDPRGEALYVVDFGVMTMSDKAEPRPGTGVLWRITRSGSSAGDGR